MTALQKYSQTALLLMFAIYGGSVFAEEDGPSATPTLKTLYSFTSPDGSSPGGGLVSHASSLYGATLAGGASNQGAVYELSPPAAGGKTWTEAVLYSFTGANDGGQCWGNVVFDSQGALYGVTLAGGEGLAGTVYQLTPPAVEGGAWTEAVLHSFTGGADGGSPAGIMFGSNGSLYGTATTGGASNQGTAFQLTPPAAPGDTWTYAVIHNFGGGKDGASPGAALIAGSKGTLLGTTYLGGASNAGTVFQLTRPTKVGGAWTEAVIYSFTGGSDGGYPDAALTAVASGALYGTASYGGATQDGTAFELTPPAETGGAWTYTLLHSFAGEGDGTHPYGAIVSTSTGLLGTTFSGGSTGDGTIFALKPPTVSGDPWTEVVVYDFSGSTAGGNPLGGLVPGSSGVVYGTTFAGGSIGDGTIFQITL